MGALLCNVEGKHARAVLVIVPAAAQRRGFHNRSVPRRCPVSGAVNFFTPRAAFVAYRPRGDAVVSLICTREEVLPFCPLFRPGSRDRRASDDGGARAGRKPTFLLRLVRLLFRLRANTPAPPLLR